MFIIPGMPILETIITVGAAATVIYTLYKFVYPHVKKTKEKYKFYNQEGYDIVRNIETHFGVEAGKVLRDILAKKGYDIILNQARLNIIENAIGLGIFICNKEGKCTYANKTLASMFGLQQEDMLDYGWATHIVDKQKAINNWNFSVSNAVPYSDSYEVLVEGAVKKMFTEAKYSEVEGIKIGYVGFVKEIK